MNKIRVLIVEDSAVVRGLLEHIIGMDSRLEVAATAETAPQAEAVVESVEEISVPAESGAAPVETIPPAEDQPPS